MVHTSEVERSETARQRKEANWYAIAGFPSGRQSPGRGADIAQDCVVPHGDLCSALYVCLSPLFVRLVYHNPDPTNTT
jgi:hypothetical protein